MFRPAIILCAMLLGTAPAPAQENKDDVVADFTADDLEKMLKARWKKETLDRTVHKQSIRYRRTEYSWIDFYPGADGGRKFVLSQLSYPKNMFKENLDLQKINDWNVRAVYTRAYFYRRDKEYAGITVESTLPLDAGVSSRQIERYLARLTTELDDFFTFVGGLKPLPKNDQGSAVPARPADNQFTSAQLGGAAQNVARELSVEELERKLKADLKVNTLKKKEFPGRYEYRFNDFSGLSFYHGKKGDGRKFLLYDFTWPASAFEKSVTLEAVNDWNITAVYSRAYLLRGQDNANPRIVLEATLPLDGGISARQLEVLPGQFDKEFRKFLTFVGGLKGGGVLERKDNVVRQGFPHDEDLKDRLDLSKHDTGWEIEWDFVKVHNVDLFRIASATFQWKEPDGKRKALVVLRNLYLAEAFTQYDDKKTCFLDIAKVTETKNLKASEDYLGPGCYGVGSILPSKNPALADKAHREVHFDGLRWMKVNDGVKARKGQKLVLWSAIVAGNYIYLIEYNFTDDGRVVARLGFTAHNYYKRARNTGAKDGSRFMSIPEGDVHPHIGCWRFEFDLHDPLEQRGGPQDNDIFLVRRVYDQDKLFRSDKGKFTGKGGFKIDPAPFPGIGNKTAVEGKAKWIAREFTTLRGQSSTVTNGNGKPIAYDLVSTRTGTAADLMPIAQAGGTKIDFINYDFWVTKTPPKYRHYHEVPEIASNQALKGERTTIWHSVPGLHVPRDEDFGPGGVDASRGVALNTWVEFTLRPRNVFSGTPLYP